MKYLNLIWTLFVWILICVVGCVFILSFVGGNNRLSLNVSLIFGLLLGTGIGIARYRKGQYKLSVPSVVKE